jgi:hypothetical protein
MGVGDRVQKNMMFPKKSWGQPPRSKTMKAEIPEEAIQAAVEDYIEMRGVDHIRIPDSFFRWVKMNAPKHIQAWFFGMFGGRPDDTILVPLGDGYHLALCLELKTQDKQGRAVGTFHGKQKHNKENWMVCRDPGAAILAIKNFIEVAEAMKKKVMLIEEK